MEKTDQLKAQSLRAAFDLLLDMETELKLSPACTFYLHNHQTFRDLKKAFSESLLEMARTEEAWNKRQQAGGVA